MCVYIYIPFRMDFLVAFLVVGKALHGLYLKELKYTFSTIELGLWDCA